MKKFSIIPIYLIVLPLFLLATSCKNDDEEPQLPQKTYDMHSVSDPMINGKITFIKQDETSTLVRIELSGTEDGNSHPSHIHVNAASQGGSIAIGLNDVSGMTGVSETVVTQLGNGNAINYEGLLNFNGHANVHLSPTAMSTLIAQGDIGSNEQNSQETPNTNPNNDGGY